MIIKRRCNMEKYRKLIENIRWYGALALGFAIAISGNLIVCLSIAIILGLIDQIFIKPKLKPKRKGKSKY
ncbi:hypothetical protein ACFVR1_11905 [Psychrobacillus sp. NPDC058041]|uniref:hypothetical protein n=1 Tax=Psychrobacillus sp. NPDC058041 TaxID=3346310 RepID=UPI0036DE852C